MSSSLYLMRGRLCRALVARPGHIIKRHRFSGRPPAADADEPPKPPSRPKLPQTPARTRFAPSPTGYLHIGSLRTALYNFLLARATGGQFLLRIEDTDQTRLVPGAEDRIYEDLKWAGLKWDEGPDVGGYYGPYRQSQRLNLYTAHAQRLLNEGRAYRCFCTPEELDRLKATSLQGGEQPRYSGKCSHIPPHEAEERAQSGEEHCVRFRCDHSPTITDLVYGSYRKPGDEDHFIIMKRDGYPTYHFANVVDDHLMDITHVIRGAEWLISTPKHVALYQAFGWQPPEFAHVGLLVDKDKKKLSKRDGDFEISSWRDRGVLPGALLNYVMLLGWSPGKSEKGRSDVMDLNDMITKFHLKFTKGDITVNDKHEHLQQAHVRLFVKNSTAPDAFLDQFFPAIDRAIRQCEKARLVSPGGGGLVPRLHSRLGPLVTRATLPSNRKNPLPSGGDPEVYKNYIRQLFDLDSSNFSHGAAYLVRHKFLVWEVPESLYADTMTETLRNYDSMYVAPPNMLPAKRVKGVKVTIPESERSPRSISELVYMLRSVLEGINDENWNNVGIRTKAMPFIKSVYATTKTEADQAWGFPLLRWILVAKTPGPSLTHIMSILGKTETLRRVDQAYEVAKRVEREIRDMENYAALLEPDYSP
ncbi:hypothetical protein F5X99DRAFT_361687 [Biscogniauxia marginata]|nr:hypothetical protein F5X99DRAFT_361687 [Biscogniauxia marginata]